MKFFLQTAHRDSDQFYSSGCAALPFQGVCQGNGVGPAIWLAVSIVLINMVRKNGSMSTFTSPISHHSASLVGLLYVDDCDLFTIGEDGSQPIETIKQLQTNINLWQGGLAVMGGALSPTKSLWCILAMQSQGICWGFHSTVTLPASLNIMDKNHLPQIIKWLNLQDGIAVVGVVQALSGNQKLALQVLQAKASTWETAIWKGYLPCSLAWLALHCIIWLALRYPLAITSFTEEQAFSITGRLYWTLLPQLGVHRNFPLAI